MNKMAFTEKAKEFTEDIAARILENMEKAYDLLTEEERLEVSRGRLYRLVFLLFQATYEKAIQNDFFLDDCPNELENLRRILEKKD